MFRILKYIIVGCIVSLYFSFCLSLKSAFRQKNAFSNHLILEPETFQMNVNNLVELYNQFQ